MWKSLHMSLYGVFHNVYPIRRQESAEYTNSCMLSVSAILFVSQAIIAKVFSKNTHRRIKTERRTNRLQSLGLAVSIPRMIGDACSSHVFTDYMHVQ